MKERLALYALENNLQFVNDNQVLTDNWVDLIDSIAFKISRKIWYVGRKPADMTNSDWDEMTKNMRPSQGTYSKNEQWKNFPYTKDWQYGSSS